MNPANSDENKTPAPPATPGPGTPATPAKPGKRRVILLDAESSDEAIDQALAALYGDEPDAASAPPEKDEE